MNTANEPLRRALEAYSEGLHHAFEDIRAYLAAEPFADSIPKGVLKWNPEAEQLKKLLDKDSGSLSADEIVLLSEWLLLSVKTLGVLVSEQFPRPAEPEAEAEPVAWVAFNLDSNCYMWSYIYFDSKGRDLGWGSKYEFRPIYSHPPRPEPEAKPVAWGYKNPLGEITDCFSNSLHKGVEGKGSFNIPLYTNPSPSRKPMTEEEIRELGESFRNNPNPEKFIDFARAIEKHHQIGASE